MNFIEKTILRPVFKFQLTSIIDNIAFGLFLQCIVVLKGDDKTRKSHRKNDYVVKTDCLTWEPPPTRIYLFSFLNATSSIGLPHNIHRQSPISLKQIIHESAEYSSNVSISRLSSNRHFPRFCFSGSVFSINPRFHSATQNKEVKLTWGYFVHKRLPIEPMIFIIK